MKKIKYTILLQLLTLASFSYAQNRNDSLKVVWENETQTDSARFDALEKYSGKNGTVLPDSTLIYLDYYHQLALEKNAQRQVFRALNRKANIYRLKREFDTALELFNEALIVAKKLENKRLQTLIQGNIGNIYLDQNKYLEATRHYSPALKVFQELKDSAGEARMMIALGGVNSEIGNNVLALEYYQKSLTFYNQRKASESDIAHIVMNIGLAQYENDAYKDAKSSFEKALNYLQIEKNIFLISDCYHYLALINLELNQLIEANIYAQKALKLNNELQVEKNIFQTEIVTAQIAYQTNTDSATKQAELILNKLPQKSSYEIKSSLYELLYKCYKSQNKLNLSLQMHELYTFYKDSMQIESDGYAVVRETIKSDYELRIYETKLESEKEKVELELKQLKTTYGIVSISAIIISLLIFYLLSASRKNKKRRGQLLDEIKNLKENTATELVVDSNKFELKREKIDLKLERNLNETDWKVLNILLEDPAITNKEIAEKAHMSIDGIGSSLRRMYEYFEIKESKYKKITLLLEAIKISNAPI
ncbi:tetratricopeptide repeat protein [Bacteroidia bacterium]|nr:tetratricopeptide repeat protein [Bacteroidia bacterium]